MREDKLKIIYSPSLIIKDPKILTTLCLLYDEVMLFNNDSIEEEVQILDELFQTGQVTNELIEKSKFISGPLETLSKESILRVYTPNLVKEVYPESRKLEVDLKIKDNYAECGRIEMFMAKPNVNNFTQIILSNIALLPGVTVDELVRLLNIYSVAEAYDIPIINDGIHLQSKNYQRLLSDAVTLMSMCKFVLPGLTCDNPDTILEARYALKDELIEFRSGVLELTYLLHQRVNRNCTYEDLKFECSMLVNTKIKSSIMSLENKIKCHRNKKIKNLIITTAKLILSGGNLISCRNDIKDVLDGGNSFLDTLANAGGLEKPEHKIASFIIGINQKLSRASIT